MRGKAVYHGIFGCKSSSCRNVFEVFSCHVWPGRNVRRIKIKIVTGEILFPTDTSNQITFAGN